MADKKISGTHRPHRLTSQEHYSDAFLTSAFLALSGGLQDAYTYNTRDGVFSNAQTGNVVLMSQHLMRGEWGACIRYFVPVIAFALGVFLAERICHRYKYAQKIHWRQLILSIEIVILFAVGFIPQQLNMAATVLISLTCAMQVQTFRKVGGFSYASTMHRQPEKRYGRTFRLRPRAQAGQLRQATVLLWHHLPCLRSVRDRRQSFRLVWHPGDLHRVFCWRQLFADGNR